MREGAVCFIVKDQKILLAHIEYNADFRVWNGTGGYIEQGELPVDAAVREASEETYLILDRNRLRKVAESTTTLKMHFFLTDYYEGEVKVKEPSLKELRWFSLHEIPYDQMFEGVDKWLPKVLEGKLVVITDEEVKEVSSFS